MEEIPLLATCAACATPRSLATFMLVVDRSGRAKMLCEECALRAWRERIAPETVEEPAIMITVNPEPLAAPTV